MIKYIKKVGTNFNYAWNSQTWGGDTFKYIVIQADPYVYDFYSNSHVARFSHCCCTSYDMAKREFRRQHAEYEPPNWYYERKWLVKVLFDNKVISKQLIKQFLPQCINSHGEI